MSLAECDVTDCSLKPKMTETFATRCDADKWSEAARACFLKATDDAALKACDQRLTDAQRKAYQSAIAK
jgi:hypothetical protein